MTRLHRAPLLLLPAVVLASAAGTVPARAASAPSTSPAAAATAPTYDPALDPYSLRRTLSATGVRAAWSRTRAGRGVDVALIDSGVAPVPGLDAPDQLGPGVDLSVDLHAGLGTTDTFGHGTHMAGIIAGRDPGPDPAVSPGVRTRFLGTAPDARVVPVKVADSRGTTDVSQVVAALDWVVANAHSDGRNVRVVNLSFGSDSRQDYRLDPLAAAAERAWTAGIVVVVSAGNGGRAGLGDPAYDPYVLAVGADDTAGTAGVRDDAVPRFSNRGDGTRGPDLLAPGVHQQSLRAPGSRLDRAYGDRARVGDRFFRGSGTSQATAMVSGAAALLVAQRPSLTPDQVKRLLTSTARRLPGVPAEVQGAGLLDVAAASLAPAPSSAAARQTWDRSYGRGSLDAARGTPGRLVGRITGEVGDYGAERLAQTTDPATIAAGVAASVGALTSLQPTHLFSEGVFAGTTWDGTTWDGTTWDGTTWDGTTWDGTTWDGSAWG